MFKKGFKALKSIGKKSKKKDGDSVSQAESVRDENLGASGEALEKDNRIKAAAVAGAAVHADIGSGERMSAAANPRTPGRGPPTLAQTVGSASKSGVSASAKPAMSQPVPAVHSTREMDAEDSVVDMMRQLQAQKAQKASQPASQSELMDDSDEDSESNDTASSESELTYKKKLKHKQEKEERKKKGLSVSSSSSTGSSWGDTSDVLPSPGGKPSLLAQSTNPIAAAVKKPAATAADVGEDSNSAWSDTDEEADESQPRQASPSRAIASPEVVSDPASGWSDDEVEGEKHSENKKETEIVPSSAPPQSSSGRVLASPDIVSDPASAWSDEEEGGNKPPVTDNQSKTAASSVPQAMQSGAPASPGIVSDPESAWSDDDEDKENPKVSATAEVVEPVLTEKGYDLPLNTTYNVPSADKDAAIVSNSDSTLSDSEDDDMAVDLPTGDGDKPTAVNVSSASLVANGKNRLGANVEDKLIDNGPSKLSQPSQPIHTAPSETPTNPAVLSRLKSQDSVWSDDDDIELAAAPTNNLSILAAINDSSSPSAEEVVEAPVVTQAHQSMNQTITISSPSVSNGATEQSQLKMREEIESLSKRMVDSEQREKSLVFQKEELEKELASVQQYRDELQSTVGNLETKMDDLKSLNEKLTVAEGGMVKKSMYDDVTQKLKVIIDENERLVVQHSQIEKSSSAETADLKKVIAELKETQKQHLVDQREWDEMKAELNSTILSWRDKHSALESALSQQQQTNSELEGEISGLRQKMITLQTQKREIELLTERTTGETTQVEILESELTERNNKLEMLREEMERSSKDYTENIARLNSRIAEINSSHDQEIQSMGDRHRQVLSQLKEDNERDTQRAEMRQDSLSKEVGSLQSQNKELQQKNSILRTEMSEKSRDLIPKRDYEELQKDHDVLMMKVAELQKLSAHSGPVEPEQSPLVSNFQFSASSSDDDDDIRRQRFNGNTSLVLSNAQQKELERLEEKVKQLKREVFDLEQSTSLLHTEKRTLSRQLQEKQDESDDLKVQNDKLYEKLRIRDQEVTMELNKKLEIELVSDAEKCKLRHETVLMESNISRLTEANSQLETKLATVTAELNVKDNRLRSLGEGKGQSTDQSVTDAEMVRLSTELAQLKSNAEAERSTYMAAIESKEREITVEIGEKESAKAALDEVTKSLMYLQDDLNSNYVSLSAHQEALTRANEQEDRMHRELSSLREKVETYSKDSLEAKNVCSMQQILINEKDRELRDKDKETRALRRDLDGKAEALSNANIQLQQSARERDRDHDRLRGEMLNMSLRQESPTRGDAVSYKTMYEELKVDREREKATADQLIERLKWEISTLEERLQNAKSELQDKVKLETNYLLSQGETDRYKQEAAELVRKSTRLEERLDQLQRETDHLKDSRLEVGSSNQALRDENSRVREDNVFLKSQLETVQKELSSYNVTRDEMEAALAAAKLTTDVNDMTRQDSENEVQLERKHKMVLYKQAKTLRTEINEKNVKLQELEKTTDKLKAKVAKLKAENNALHIRLKDRASVDAQRTWDVSTGLTQADIYQQEVKQLQSQLEATNNDMQSQAKKAKARKQDLSYFQSKAEDLERKNRQLSIKLSDSLLMVEAAERTAADLRNHIAQLNGRLQQYEDLDDTNMTLQELGGSRKRENRDLEREVGELKKRLSLAESGQSVCSRSSPRSRSASPTPTRYRSRTSSNRYGGQPLTEYEKDRRALTRAAWAVLDDHGMGPPAEQRVFENLDRIWRRNASRPSRHI